MPKKGERKQFCINGHDTFMCGRDKGSACKQCRKEKKDIYNKQYYYENKEILLEKKKEYYMINKNQIIADKIEYEITKILTDPLFKLVRRLRKRLTCALKGNYKSGSAVRDLGCSIEFLKDYIAAKFHNGMTWDNWGELWQLDHIVPLWKFDLTDRKQFLKAVNYKNLQPLTVKGHRIKTDKETNERARMKRGQKYE